MSKSDPFGFDMSVASAKKKNPRGKRGLTGGSETSVQGCQHEGCQEAGKFRAPKSPDVLDEFYWFCKEHVREYNLKWNFFKNHNSEEFEKHIKDDAVWSRKTNPFAKNKDKVHTEGKSWARLGFNDPHSILSQKGTFETQNSDKRYNRRLPLSERKALEILDAKDTMTKEEIRKVYKALVKDLHPDMNGGRRDDEERLAEVVWAWEQIRSSLSFKN